MARHFSPIGYTFKDERLLKAALTHRSCVCECFVREGGEEHDNQRLEFLGDAVLELFISEHLFALRPRLSEGAMSRVRACFVCEGKLAEIARGIGLGEHLVISQPEDNSGGRDKTSLLADAMEALLGAVFLDGGAEKTRSLILKLWSPYLSGCSESPPSISDYKTALQEFTQRCGMGLPVYSLSNTVGPAHKPTFFISVRVGERAPATAMARSKKEAAQHAAKILLQELMDEEARSPRPEVSQDVPSRARTVEGLVMASDCRPRPEADGCMAEQELCLADACREDSALAEGSFLTDACSGDPCSSQGMAGSGAALNASESGPCGRTDGEGAGEPISRTESGPCGRPVGGGAGEPISRTESGPCDRAVGGGAGELLSGNESGPCGLAAGGGTDRCRARSSAGVPPSEDSACIEASDGECRAAVGAETRDACAGMGDGAGRSRSGAGAVEGRTKAGPGARVKARGKVKPKDRASGAARTMPRASEGAVPGVKIHQGAGSGTGTGERPLTGGKPEADKCPEVRPGTKARPGPKPGPSAKPGPKPGPSAKPGPKPGPSAKPRQKSKSGSKSGPETRLRARRKPVDCGEDLRTGVEGPETSGTVARDGVLSEASPRFLSSTDECQAEGSRPSRPPRQPRPPRPSRLSAGAAGEGNGDSPERNGPRGAPDLSMPASQEADAPCGTDTPDTHGRAGAVDPPEGGGQ